ncbi:MAG: cobalamin B12-binding domain-containing protein [Candidatus Bipolaricaulia bacterium]
MLKAERSEAGGQVKKIRVLMAKVGLDGHDRGVKVICNALRDAGMEVIYTGLHNTPEQVVRAALQEDVDVIGVSLLSGAHMAIFPKIRRLMDEQGLGDVILLGGGIIPDEDKEELKKIGVEGLFGPGTPTQEIVKYIEEAVRRKGRS